jgi:hypothetical protein
MKNVAGILATATLSLLLLAPAASAQSAGSIELTRANIQKSRQAIIVQAMDLTEEESLAFWPAYRDYRLDVARLGDRLVRVLDELLKSGATLSDEQATRLLDESLDIQAKQVAVRREHVKAFRKLLPPAKVARFFQLENKLDAVVNYELAQAIPLAR